MYKPQYETFAIDCLLADHGHTVIRVPPDHPDLNPIEHIWDVVKTRIAAKNVTFKLRNVQQLAEQNFAAITLEEWAAVCRHVKAVEEEYMSTEHEMDSLMERILISADDDDDHHHHAQVLLVHVSLTDRKILEIAYKPSLKRGKLQIKLYKI
jgi:hypothetical protein